MAYIGVSPSNGVRQKHTYTATASQTTFSGAGAEGVSLSYRDSNYVDVYVNGVKLGDADYTATSGTSIVLGEGAAVNDIVEVIVYDVFSVADTVSKADGGVFDGNVTMAGTLAVTGETTLSANLNLGDNDKAIFGAGDDLQIYHDGSNSYIDDQGTGNIKYRAALRHQFENTDSSKIYMQLVGDTVGQEYVQLRYNNATKLATTNTGIDVTGVITTDGMTTSADINFGDNDKAVFGAGSDLQIYHTGTYSLIADTSGTGPLRVVTNTFQLNNAADTQNMINAAEGGAVNLYHAGNAKIATTSTGIDVTGTAVTDGLTVAGNLSVDGGTIKLDGNYPTGTDNVALGNTALDSGSLTGARNTAIGSASLTANTSGQNNVSIGYNSMLANTSGSENISVGVGALDANIIGGNNTALGRSALTNNTASNNTAVGYNSLFANTTGTLNIALGREALYSNQTSSNITAVGYQALYANTASNQTAVGWKALNSNTTGTSGTAVGYNALEENTTGGYNTAFGRQALQENTTASSNTAMGYTALRDNTTGASNTAVGYLALQQNTTGSTNTAVGKDALDSNTEGSFNVGIGGDTLQTNSTGNHNTAVGSGALFANTTSNQNTAVGYEAGRSNTTAGDNTYIGWQAGRTRTGSGNTCVGQYSGRNGTTGTDNTLIGRNAGYEITSGSKNTIIGTYDGNAGGLDIRTSNNYIVLSDGDGNPRIISDDGGRIGIGGNPISNRRLITSWASTGAYNFQIRTTPSSGNIYGQSIFFTSQSPDNNSSTFLQCSDNTTDRLRIYADGDVVNHDNSYGSISDIKLKEQITNASSQWDDIKALTVRKYKMKSDVATGDSDAHWRLGLVAQEVETAGMNGLVKTNPDMTENEDGELVDSGTTTKTVKYSILYMKAVKALQEAMERIETLEAKVATLEGA